MVQCYTLMGGDRRRKHHGSEHAQHVAEILLVDRVEYRTVVHSSMRAQNPNMLGFDFG
jgi:hypothetical protein